VSGRLERSSGSQSKRVFSSKTRAWIQALIVYLVPLDMNTENSYICSQCTKKVGVILDVKTVLKTEPIQEDPLRNPQIIKDVEEALKDPRHNDRI
jgi:DNA-directed RNA polymerase subunit RPC12/RpoP